MSVPADTQQLADREAIKELAASYCYAVDEQNWEQLRNLFTDDATLDYGEDDLGRFEGHEEIPEFTAILDKLLEVTSHMVSNPMLHIDGDRATGRWYVDAREALTSGKTALTQGEYRDVYRRVDGEWKIAERNLRIEFQVLLEDEEILNIRRQGEIDPF